MHCFGDRLIDLTVTRHCDCGSGLLLFCDRGFKLYNTTIVKQKKWRSERE
jgi:hypothetical protein